MADVIIPCDIVARTLGKGSSNAENVRRALRKMGTECSVPFGPLPDAKYLIHITHTSSRFTLATLLEKCGVERV